MANFILPQTTTVEDKIVRMREDAKFEIAGDLEISSVCTPLSAVLGDIHAKAAPPKVPKVFVSNHCTFNCAYCGCRASRDTMRYCHQPKEMAYMALQEAKNNGHGVFVTSAICRNADYTEELIVETLKILRKELHYQGYVHAKIMPGTDPILIAEAGKYANRLSVNIEVAQSDGYQKIAKQKTRDNILTPMGQISELIQAARMERSRFSAPFATSQTTQIMAGSTGESDRRLMVLSQALYRKYHLQRVYYTPFHYQHAAQGYDLPFVATPRWRVRRLYQADRLIQLYGFTPDEITPEEHPDLDFDLDPKTVWALRNMHLFPVEVNTADYEMLLRIPGIGEVGAKKIIEVRRWCVLTHDILRKLRISLKKSIYFITCNGKYVGGKQYDNPEYLYRRLAGLNNRSYTSVEQLQFASEING